jgi:hypothetical protein
MYVLVQSGAIKSIPYQFHGRDTFRNRESHVYQDGVLKGRYTLSVKLNDFTVWRHT